jgi:Neprosin
VPEVASPTTSDPPMNEDGQVSIPRRGLLAAGLAAAVAGSLGVFSTVNAAADETPAPPAPAAAEEVRTPPPLLPWGEEPAPLKLGAPGASSATLAATGADAAPASADPTEDDPVVGYGTKGFASGKRMKRTDRTVVPPQPPSVLADPAPPNQGRTVRFHYAGAYQYAESEGSFAGLTIAKPYLHSNDYHTLAEIAVQSRDGDQKVEVGWTIDRSLNGDTDPHLFVYHWVDDEPTCYNGCGFVPWSDPEDPEKPNIKPGDTLPAGKNLRFGIKYWEGAWWLSYDSTYFGYFKDTEWDGRFTKAGLIQWFGEVASKSLAPCSYMGNGWDPKDPKEMEKAARFLNVALVNGPPAVLRPSSSSPDVPAVYNSVLAESAQTVLYGGDSADGCGR